MWSQRQHQIAGNFCGTKFLWILWLSSTVIIKIKALAFHVSSIIIDCGTNNHNYTEIHQCLELSCEQINTKFQFYAFHEIFMPQKLRASYMVDSKFWHTNGYTHIQTKYWHPSRHIGTYTQTQIHTHRHRYIHTDKYIER